MLSFGYGFAAVVFLVTAGALASTHTAGSGALAILGGACIAVSRWTK